MAAELASIANELYALTPGEFTAARNARAKAEAKDKALAASIRRLPKPSASAWLVNMLVRHEPTEIDRVISLGFSLRAAQEQLNRTDMTSLSRERRELLSALSRRAAALADRLGSPVSAAALGEVDQTLQAAMADADAASAASTGRLVRPLASVGFESVDLSDAVAAADPAAADPAARAPAPPEPDDSAARELAAAQQKVDEAERREREAETELEQIDDRIESAERRREQLAAELDELKAQVDELENDIAAIDRDSRSLDRHRDKVERSADQARRDAARSREQLTRLK